MEHYQSRTPQLGCREAREICTSFPKMNSSYFIKFFLEILEKHAGTTETNYGKSRIREGTEFLACCDVAISTEQLLKCMIRMLLNSEDYSIYKIKHPENNANAYGNLEAMHMTAM